MLFFSEQLTLIKLTGIVLAFAALFLSVYKPGQMKRQILFWLLPLSLFVGNGLVDSIIKYAQATYIANSDVFLFNSFVFSFALLSGLLILLASRSSKMAINRKQKAKQVGSFGKVALWGVLLGLINFGSLWAMVSALNSSIESSVVFLLNNTGVVVLASLIGFFIYHEKTTRLNLLGIILALGSIVLLTYSTYGN